MGASERHTASVGHTWGQRRPSTVASRANPQPVFQLSSADFDIRPDHVELLARRPLALLSTLPKPLVLFAAGAIAGALGKTATAPLDRVKILLQVKGGLQKGAVEAAARSGGVLRSLMAIGKEEGVLGFWKGNLPQVLRVVPYSAAQLCSYEVLKHALADENGDLPLARRFIAGACAGMISTLATYPLDTLRLRLAVDPNVRSVRDASQVLYREGGVAAFFRGLVPAMTGIAPYMALELAAFDLLPQDIPAFSRGFTAALIATSFCYPLDTVRRQIQLQSKNGLPLLQTIKGIKANDGIGGFYRGFVPNAIKNLPNKGIRLSTFDAVKSLFALSQVAYQEEVEAARTRQINTPPKSQSGPDKTNMVAWASVSHDIRSR
ncbi:hypothetical protein BSKO_11398 [Bryopsis sp. KO-2023]|nr:hypothetical protein BSKO_11398 [Bryopsis sp. KO-2023]